MSKENKILPKLRFPEFMKNGEWSIDKVESLISIITPPKKLQTSEYLGKGKFPIIDQSKSFYCGWTNDSQSIISKDLPLIIFGDHTCILKMAREPFSQGADRIKILKTKEDITPEFLFQFLQHGGVKLESYKRHFSKLKEKEVLFPEIEKGEQQKIASCLSSLDDLIAAHNDKLEALKDHKKGLMQNLFPQEGHKVPNYRFPEFKNDGEWVSSKLNEVAAISSGGTPSREKKEYWNGNIPWVSTTLIDFNEIKKTKEFITPLGLENSSTKSFPKGTILMAMYGQGKTRGKVAILGLDATINQACAAIILKKDMDTNFVFQNLAARYKEIRSISNQGGQQNLSGGIIKNISIIHPNVKSSEQQKIASCLSALDELITSQTEKIEQLQQHKKGLMQGLFPKID
ncbi:MAG: restriction endonuclease subunit S [Flavobacteriaceae bacterium]|nr:restriction endonuclease subunit S [Flavobacteriaceae bacterium]